MSIFIGSALANSFRVITENNHTFFL